MQKSNGIFEELIYACHLDHHPKIILTPFIISLPEHLIWIATKISKSILEKYFQLKFDEIILWNSLAHTHDLSLWPKNLHTNMANRIFNCMLVKQIFNLLPIWVVHTLSHSKPKNIFIHFNYDLPTDLHWKCHIATHTCGRS